MKTAPILDKKSMVLPGYESHMLEHKLPGKMCPLQQ